MENKYYEKIIYGFQFFLHKINLSFISIFHELLRSDLLVNLRKRDRKRAPIPWFTPHMPTNAQDWARQKLEARNWIEIMTWNQVLDVDVGILFTTLNACLLMCLTNHLAILLRTSSFWTVRPFLNTGLSFFCLLMLSCDEQIAINEFKSKITSTKFNQSFLSLVIFLKTSFYKQGKQHLFYQLAHSSNACNNWGKGRHHGSLG